VTRRFIHYLYSGLLATLLLAFAFVHASAFAAAGIEITQAHLENAEEGYKLSATFAFDLNHNLEDAINHGIPLHFTTEVEMTRPRWYWFDESAINAQRTVRISKNLLTNEYQATILGGVQQSFNTLDDALALLRRPSRWVVAERNALKSGATYNVAVHMELNLHYLSKPIHLNALNNSDWSLASDWKHFPFKAE
jgi:phosphomannomutase